MIDLFRYAAKYTSGRLLLAATLIAVAAMGSGFTLLFMNQLALSLAVLLLSLASCMLAQFGLLPWFEVEVKEKG